MCGLTGLFDPRAARDAGRLAAEVGGMTASIEHRGPDGQGIWLDAPTGIALGHRRLSVIDLSVEGHQPMLSTTGRYVLAFNGEVYNHRELGAELAREGRRFRGHSDSEVLLAAVERWGVPGALRRAEGQLALALWDRQERRLFLARDRLGKKPLYYGMARGTLIFGSELKALRAHPQCEAEIDRGALALYLRHNCIPAPYSIHRGIFKLPPGSLLAVDGERLIRTHAADDLGTCIEPYWSARSTVEGARADPFRGSDAEAVEALGSLLRDAVAQRLVSDVPLGAFLSGGVDSSLVVALMQQQSSRPVKTFTLGFEVSAYDEAEAARAVARHLGTDHTELCVRPAEALAVIPTLPEIYDEPFGDSSQIPALLLARLARSQVTVALSGDGGDEIFGGYNRHFLGARLWRGLEHTPRALRRLAATALTAVPQQRWDRIYPWFHPLLPPFARQSAPGDKLHKLAGVLDADSPESLYRTLASHWQDGPVLAAHAESEPPTLLTDRGRWPELPEFAERMMYLDLVTYLPDDILVKVDRASMAVALEVRAPLLDHRLLEFAWRLPLSQRVRQGVGKWLLRQVLYRHVPPALIERPKAGFAVPIDDWLRGALRDWCEALLDPRRLREEGFFDPAPIRKKWAEHLSGRRNWQYDLWDVLMFQAWLAAQSTRRAVIVGGSAQERVGASLFR